MYKSWAENEPDYTLIIYATSSMDFGLDGKVDESRRELIKRKYIKYSYYVDEKWVDNEDIEKLKEHAKTGPIDFGKDIKSDLAKLKLVQLKLKWK